MNNHKQLIGKTGTVLILVSMGWLLLGAVSPIPAVAADAVASSEQALTKDISQLEHRFFAREYIHDPMEKRLERLELMVFGGTQSGSQQERFSRLSKSIVTRNEHAPVAKAGAGKPTNLQSSSQYPVLKTLEWRAFKKTFPSDTLADRLGRLEKKTFGADNTSMSYADRVDRLRRTLGVDTVAQQPAVAAPQIIGPAPKARPRGQMGQDMWGFGAPPMIGNGNVDPFGEDEQDGMPSLGMPRQGMPGLGGMGLSATMNNMLREMDRQMAQLQQMPSGSYSFSFDPKTGEWIDRSSGRRIKPGQGAAPQMPKMPSDSTPFKAPSLGPQFQHNDGALPPYSDPNSI